MKTFAIIFIICLVALVRAEEDYVQATKYFEACFKDLGITEGFVGDLTERQEKCGTACLFKALKLINEDGTVNVEIIAANSNLSLETIKSGVEKCQRKAQNGKQDSACEIAFCLQRSLLYYITLGFP